MITNIIIIIIVFSITGWAVELVFLALHSFDSPYNNIISLFLIFFLPITIRQKIAGARYATLRKENYYKILLLIRPG